MKLLKITNPAYVAQLAPDIQKFVERVELKNINYHSLVAHFQRTVQFGGEAAELWVAFNRNEPVGFAHWSVRDIPLVGTVYMDYIYSRGNRKDVAESLIAEWVNFGKKYNSVWYMADVINHPKLVNHLKHLANKFGYTMEEKPYIPFLLRKKADESNNQSNDLHEDEQGT